MSGSNRDSLLDIHKYSMFEGEILETDDFIIP